MYRFIYSSTVAQFIIADMQVTGQPQLAFSQQLIARSSNNPQENRQYLGMNVIIFEPNKVAVVMYKNLDL
ncbi:MAG: hypothetical protein JWP94_2530 [Mucilaginibacter sp.]|nr:hypothetical protein [Mucilaginibacter sp.]